MSNFTATAENVEYPSFDTTKATDQMRAFAEQGVEQSKEVFERMKTGAEHGQKAFEATYETARGAGADLSRKAIAAMRANAEAGFSFVESMLGVKSLSESFELQTAFFRSQIETAVDQAKDLQATASKAAEDVSKPVRDVFQQALKELKVA